MEINNFWVDIENSSGVRQGKGPLQATYFDISSLLSASGEFSFQVSIADPNLSALAEKRVAICRYFDRTGATKVFGGGVIDKIEMTIAQDGSAMVDVSGNDLGRELNYRSVGQLALQKVPGISGSPVTLSVAVALSDNASAIAGKIRTALLANSAITNIYDVAGSGASIILTKKTMDDNDPTLNIRIQDDSCVGITLLENSTNTIAGVWGATYQVETATVVGTITTAGNATVIVTADGVGIFNGPEQIMALAPAGWTLADGTTLLAVYKGFDGESCLNALTQITKTIGEHWRIEAGRVIQWLGPASTFDPSGVRAVQNINDVIGIEAQTEIAIITGLKKISDATDLITRILPRGSGNGGAVTTLEFCTNSMAGGFTLDTAANYLKHNAAEATYGRIERPINFKDLGPLSNTTADIQAAANMLLMAAYQYLRLHCSPQEFYEISLAEVNQMLLPGTSLHVVHRELLDGVVIYDLDNDFYIVETRNRIDATGPHTTGVTVSTIDRLPQTDSGFMAGQVQENAMLSVHQQLGAMVDTLPWRDEMDDDHAANFRFWLGAEYTSISRALLRFQIKPLRSTVKSVGSTSTTTSSGGGQTSSEDGGHQHVTNIPDGAGNQVISGYADSGFLTIVAPGSGGLIETTGAGGDHTHDINDHTHNVTPVVSMNYGIFEETSGNTLALVDLAIKLNGGSDLSAGVSDIGNGWYELDITDVLTDVVFRPSQENNLIEISTGTAKTARIEAQLTIRAVVQAVYYE